MKSKYLVVFLGALNVLTIFNAWHPNIFSGVAIVIMSVAITSAAVIGRKHE